MTKRSVPSLALEDHAVMLGAAFVIAPFRGNEGAAGGLAKGELWRSGPGFAGVEPIQSG